MDLNVSAYIEGTAVALQAFEATGEGVIICTASMAGLLPVGAPPVYSATKACNIQMVRALASALDMEGSDIKMCARPCPPSIMTDPLPALLESADCAMYSYVGVGCAERNFLTPLLV